MHSQFIRKLLPAIWRAEFSDILHVLSRFEVDVLRRVVDAGISIRPLDKREQYRDVSPKIRTLDIGVDAWPIAPAGLFVVEERCIYLRTLNHLSIAHEFGHAIDCAFGNGRYLSDVDADIQRAYREARVWVTPYSASRIDEYFAEAIRAYINANDPTTPWMRATRETLARSDPAMYRIVNKLLQPSSRH